MIFATACSGIGVPEIAARELGWKAAFACEREPFPRAVLEYRFGLGLPGHAPLYGDMLTLRAAYHPETEAFIAGTPCQSFSIAGLRGGMADDRGNLALKFVELCHEFQDTARNFRWALWENVPGVLSDNANAFGTFISALVGGHAPVFPPGSCADDFTEKGRAEIKAGERKRPRSWPSAGMVQGPRARLAWRILDAQYFGVPQRRRRVFVVVSFGDGDPAAVLFEPIRRQGNPSKGRKSREGTAAATLRGSNGGSGVDHAAGGQLIPDIVGALTDGNNGGGLNGQDAYTGRIFAVPIAHALTREGFDASEDGTGRGTQVIAINGRQDPCWNEIVGAIDTDGASQVIAFSGKDYGADAGDLAPTLRAMNGRDGNTNGGGQVAIAYSIMPMNSGKDYTGFQTDIAQPVMASGPAGGNQGGDYIVQPIAYAIQERAGAGRDESGPDGKGWQEGQALTLEARTTAQTVATTLAVRRLTPRECERCQGLPDDWTLIPTWNAKRPNWKRDLEETARFILQGETFESEEESAARWQETCELAAMPDGPRYKAIGNAWAYPCGLWIMRRMDAEDRKTFSEKAA